MSTSERLLRAVQFNTITALRNRLGSEQFIEWLVTPCHMDGMTPVEALESGLWQEFPARHGWTKAFNHR